MRFELGIHATLDPFFVRLRRAWSFSMRPDRLEWLVRRGKCPIFRSLRKKRCEGSKIFLPSNSQNVSMLLPIAVCVWQFSRERSWVPEQVEANRSAIKVRTAGRIDCLLSFCFSTALASARLSNFELTADHSNWPNDNSTLFLQGSRFFSFVYAPLRLTPPYL